MKYYQSFEGTYKKLRPLYRPKINLSLCEFFESEVKQRLPQGESDILELGCGASSLFEQVEFSGNVLGLDVSPTAIELAKKFSVREEVKYIKGDICQYREKNKYDLVFDGHLFHCLTSDKDRQNALKNIVASLKMGGLFVLETMTSHKQMRFSKPFHFLTENHTLYRFFTQADFDDLVFFGGEPYLPVRKIKHALEIENEILNAGLQIIYLYVYSNRKIIPDESRDHPLPVDPDSLRLIAIKG